MGEVVNNRFLLQKKKMLQRITDTRMENFGVAENVEVYKCISDQNGGGAFIERRKGKIQV